MQQNGDVIPVDGEAEGGGKQALCLAEALNPTCVQPASEGCMGSAGKSAYVKQYFYCW